MQLYRIIATYVRTSPNLFAFIAAGGMFELLFHYLSALSYKFLIDEALLRKNGEVLAAIVGALLLLGTLNVGFGIAGDYAKAKLGSRLVYDYRMALFCRMQRGTSRFHRRFPIGDLLARYSDDIPNIHHAVMQAVSIGFVSAASLLVGLVLLIVIEFRLTLVAIAGSALLLVPYRLLKARSLRLNRAYSEQLGLFGGVVDESIKLRQTIRAFDIGETMREIEIRGVSFAYEGGEDVLKNLDLVIPARGFVSIMGASGSGKSTLLQLLLRFERPTGGSIRIDGADIRDFEEGSLLKRIGVVFQDPLLFEGTVRDNIRVGKPEAEQAEIEHASRAAGIHETIAGLRDGYDTVVAEQGGSLSGGQKQRIALARALIRQPDILLLDETTSALDANAERAILGTMRALSKSMAVVSVTHRLSFAAGADRIVVLEQGQVAEAGAHDALMKREGPYRRMWDKQRDGDYFERQAKPC